MKLYAKLGMMNLVHEYAGMLNFSEEEDELNYQRLGAAKLSIFSDFGMQDHLEDLMSEYKDFYRDRINENKNAIVTGFLERDFDNIWSLMQDNEKKAREGFHHTIQLT